jgi:preprotein translocase subunit SecA
MEAEDISATIDALWNVVVNQVINNFIPPQSLEEQWDVFGLEQACTTEFSIRLPIQRWLDSDDSLVEESLREKIVGEIRSEYANKEEQVGSDIRLIEKRIMLDIVDSLWKEHLAAMDFLRQGIHLRAYAQKQPKQEYKREAFELFETLLNDIQFEVIRVLTRVQFQPSEDAEQLERRRREAEAKNRMSFQKEGAGQVQPELSSGDSTPFVRRERKVGRNEPCPCGSGKKYKACHGKLG